MVSATSQIITVHDVFARFSVLYFAGPIESWSRMQQSYLNHSFWATRLPPSVSLPSQTSATCNSFPCVSLSYVVNDANKLICLSNAQAEASALRDWLELRVGLPDAVAEHTLRRYRRIRSITPSFIKILSVQHPYWSSVCRDNHRRLRRSHSVPSFLTGVLGAAVTYVGPAVVLNGFVGATCNVLLVLHAANGPNVAFEGGFAATNSLCRCRRLFRFAPLNVFIFKT